jgi:hypothetical protein
MAEEIRLSKKDSLRAVEIRDRLKNEYTPFFGHLVSIYPTGYEESKIISNILDRIKRAQILIERVFLRGIWTDRSSKELIELNEHLTAIEVARETVLQRAAIHKHLRESLDQAEGVTQIRPKEMSLAVRLSKPTREAHERRVSGRGRVSEVLHHLGITPTTALAGGAASQVLAPLLGPFFGPAAALLGAGVVGKRFLPGLAMAGPRAARGIYRLLAGRYALGRRAVGAVGRGAKGLAGIPGRIGRWWTEPTGYEKGRPPGVPSSGGPAAPAAGAVQPNQPLIRRFWSSILGGPSAPSGAPVSGSAVPSVAPAGVPPMPAVGVAAMAGARSRRGGWTRRALRDATMPIWFFFHRLAFRARWTREVLQTLKGRGAGRETGALAGVLSKIPWIAMTKFAGVMAAAAFAGYETYKLGKVLHRAWGAAGDIARYMVRPVRGMEKLSTRLKKEGWSDERIRDELGTTMAQIERDEAFVEKQQKFYGTQRRSFTTMVGGALHETAKIVSPWYALQSWIGRKLATPEIVTPTGVAPSIKIEGIDEIVGAVKSLETTTKDVNRPSATAIQNVGPYESQSATMRQINEEGVDTLQDRLNR